MNKKRKASQIELEWVGATKNNLNLTLLATLKHAHRGKAVKSG